MLTEASVAAYHRGMAACAGLAIPAGIVGLARIRDAPRTVPAAGCPGGAICGASIDLASAAPSGRRSV